VSTHNIGPFRLLFGSLVLLLVGAGAFWYLWERTTGVDALIVRGGALEIEPWSGELRADGADRWWDHAVGAIHLSIARSENDGDEYVLADPITLSAVKSIRIDVRVGNVRIVENALVLDLRDNAVKLSLKEGQLVQKGDIWVPPGFAQEGHRQAYEIARIQVFDRNDQVISRYQNPDMGRRLRFRLKLTAASGR
jgi:hypothetical protein